jgi:hypothetical protein
MEEREQSSESSRVQFRSVLHPTRQSVPDAIIRLPNLVLLLFVLLVLMVMCGRAHLG